jgi:hypothetical protein
MKLFSRRPKGVTLSPSAVHLQSLVDPEVTMCRQPVTAEGVTLSRGLQLVTCMACYSGVAVHTEPSVWGTPSFGDTTVRGRLA